MPNLKQLHACSHEYSDNKSCISVLTVQLIIKHYLAMAVDRRATRVNTTRLKMIAALELNQEE